MRKPVYMDRTPHSQILKEAQVHTVRSQLLRRRLAFYRPILDHKNADSIAIRAVLWSPMPWESRKGGLKTHRLLALASDIEKFVQANRFELSATAQSDGEVKFREGAELRSFNPGGGVSTSSERDRKLLRVLPAGVGEWSRGHREQRPS